jgi:hypothetical protein
MHAWCMFQSSLTTTNSSLANAPVELGHDRKRLGRRNDDRNNPPLLTDFIPGCRMVCFQSSNSTFAASLKTMHACFLSASWGMNLVAIARTKRHPKLCFAIDEARKDWYSLTRGKEEVGWHSPESSRTWSLALLLSGIETRGTTLDWILSKSASPELEEAETRYRICVPTPSRATGLPFPWVWGWCHCFDASSWIHLESGPGWLGSVGSDLVAFVIRC